MSPATFDGPRTHLTIGTIGHHDHGKTTLTAAITKILAKKGLTTFLDHSDIDRTPAERYRGMSIDTAHVEYSTDKRHYVHIDCPAWPDYGKNTVVGTSQMDSAIIVLDSTSGPMQQSVEHMLFARQLGIRDVVVFVNKMDLVEDFEKLVLFEDKMRQLLDKYGFDGTKTPFIRGSALCALEDRNPEIGEQAISKLLDAIDNIPPPHRDLKSSFIMPIESVFSSAEGTIASGKVEKGSLKNGDEVEIVGFKRPLVVKVSSIKSMKPELDIAVAGEIADILVPGVKRKELSRGMLLTQPSTLASHRKILAALHILETEEGGRHSPIKEGYMPSIFIRTANMTCTLKFPNLAHIDHSRTVLPGEDVEMEIELIKKTPIQINQNFILRESGLTIGIGTVIKILG